MGCEHCDLNCKCPVLNRSQCPINILWARVDELKASVLDALWYRKSEAQAAIEEAEYILRGGA
uniref:Uncharacterized protein n=1 Tax=viral metagenome TaxID=1070528 RepID=A0A6M3Y445_9ZZZZ